MKDSAYIWLAIDSDTGERLTPAPVSLNTVAAIQKNAPPGSVRLDTVNGGGSSWTDYPDDEITKLAHKLMENNNG